MLRLTSFCDLRFSGTNKLTGVGKHVIQMLQGLAACSDLNVDALVTRDQLGPDGAIPRENALSFLASRRLPFSWKTAEATWTITGRPWADRWCRDTDWVYCPKNDLIPLRNTRLAVTFHGAPELDPHFPFARTPAAILNRLRRRTAYQRMVQHATAILTVSEFLKAQVVDWFDADPNKVHVVGNGVEPDYFAAAEQPCGLSGVPVDRPYILAVGGLNKLDGGDRVLEVASLLRHRAPELRILVAGSQHVPSWEARSKMLGNVELLGYVPANRLTYYYRDANALLFLTRYETFGIAAAEAMAVGTPVVTCQCTAVPEVVGNAGLYTDPDQPDTVVDALLHVISNATTRFELVDRGRLRSRAFTWSSCVQRLIKILNDRS